MKTEFEFTWAEMIDADPVGYDKLVTKVAETLRTSRLGEVAQIGHEICEVSSEEVEYDYRETATAVLKAIWEEDDE